MAEWGEGAGSWAGAGLLLVAHGSPDPRSGQVIQAIADAVGRRSGQLAVVGFLDHQAPSIAAAAAQLEPAVPVLIPMLLGAGYHLVNDVPAAAAAAGPMAVTAAPLGPDPALLTALDRQLDALGLDTGLDGRSAVLLVAATSAPHILAGVDQLATTWKRRSSVTFASGKSVAAGVAGLLARVERVVVAPFLLAPGVLNDRIATVARGSGAQAVTDPLGADEAVVDLVIQRARVAYLAASDASN